MIREKIEIKPEILYLLFARCENEVEGFKVIENDVVSSDPNYGTGHNFVLKEISTGKFYSGSYSYFDSDTDWDCDNTDYDKEKNSGGRVYDFNCSLIQLFPQSITEVIYT